MWAPTSMDPQHYTPCRTLNRADLKNEMTFKSVDGKTPAVYGMSQRVQVRIHKILGSIVPI